jgi:Ca2+-binding EF-hand superfamily protein
LLDLLLSLSDEQSRQEGVVHRGITCNQCHASIRGVRYKCLNCADLDICESCELEDQHHPGHVFVKIRIPIPPLSNPRTTLVTQSFYPGSCPPIEDLTAEQVRAFVQTTHFEASEVEALRQQFKVLAVKSAMSGTIGIDRATFERCLGPLGMERNLIADRIFQFFDQDNDECIDFDEFVQGLSVLCKGTLLEKMKHAFKGYDLDNDGYISKEDLRKMYRAYFNLSMELVRDAVRAIEQEMLEEFDEKTQKPVSAAFTAPIPESQSPPQQQQQQRPLKLLPSSSASPASASGPGHMMLSSPVAETLAGRRMGILPSPLTSPQAFPHSLALHQMLSTPTSAASPIAEPFLPVMESMSQDAIEEMVERTFLAVDRHGNGRISYDEFEAFVQNDSTLIAWFEALGSVF